MHGLYLFIARLVHIYSTACTYL